MADENKDQASRIKIDDLPAAEQELTTDCKAAAQRIEIKRTDSAA